MKKIISLFKRDYQGSRLADNEVTEGAEWVINEEGVPTIKLDGTCCRFHDEIWWKRYDRKLTNKAKRRRNRDGTADGGWNDDDFKAPPPGWESAEDKPNFHTGHWPGWLPVSDEPADKWHRLAVAHHEEPSDGTYELIGPKVQKNPYGLSEHQFIKHGSMVPENDPGRSFDEIRSWLEKHPQHEGLVWHHEDGRMVKIKRRDFGFEWPPVVDDP